MMSNFYISSKYDLSCLYLTFLIILICEQERRKPGRTFAAGRPPYARSGYLTGSFRKLWTWGTSSSLESCTRTPFSIRACIVTNDPYARYQISKQGKACKDMQSGRSTLVIRTV